MTHEESFERAYSLLPDRIKQDSDMEALDGLIDLVAANSNYTNTQVFVAFAKLIHNICGTGRGFYVFQ